MSDPVDRITDVLRKHVSAQTENWETKLRCECGQGDFTTKLEYAQHVASALAVTHQEELRQVARQINLFLENGERNHLTVALALLPAQEGT